MKSLLSSFSSDFNRTLSVYPETVVVNNIGEREITWDTPSDTGIKCLLLLNKEKHDQYVNSQAEYIKTSHKIRMEFGPTIVEGDKVKDENDIWYNVKFVTNATWFDGNDDHLLVLSDIIR